MYIISLCCGVCTVICSLTAYFAYLFLLKDSLTTCLVCGIFWLKHWIKEMNENFNKRLNSHRKSGNLVRTTVPCFSSPEFYWLFSWVVSLILCWDLQKYHFSKSPHIFFLQKAFVLRLSKIIIVIYFISKEAFFASSTLLQPSVLFICLKRGSLSVLTARQLMLCL